MKFREHWCVRGKKDDESASREQDCDKFYKWSECVLEMNISTTSAHNILCLSGLKDVGDCVDI